MPRRRTRTTPPTGRPDLRRRRSLASMTEAEHSDWDARTLTTATRAWATFKLILAARLARADPSFRDPTFCDRADCLKHAQCRGGPSEARTPPPCVQALVRAFGAAEQHADGAAEMVEAWSEAGSETPAPKEEPAGAACDEGHILAAST